MALVVADRVQETTTTTGTGTITLAGAVSGFQSFATIGNGNTTYYCITSGSAWEVGIGTYSTTGPTLARTTILASSAAGAAITLSGTSNVFCTYPAGNAVYEDGSNLVSGYAISGGSINNTPIGATTANTGAFTTLTASTSAVVSVNTSSDALRVTQTGTGNALVVEDSTNPDSTPFAVDTTGAVLVGYTATIAKYSAAGANRTPQVQVQGTALNNASQVITNWAAGTTTTGASYLMLGKSTSGTIGTQGALTATDQVIGVLQFNGDDGTNFIPAALIRCDTDNTPGTNDMPGKLIFSTTADGAAAPTERLRISSTGLATFSGPILLAAGTSAANTAPLKFTSGTNLTTPESGAMEFDGNTFYSTEDTTSGRGCVPSQKFYRQIANGTTTTAGAIADFFPANSSISLAASSLYEIECWCYFLKTTAGTVTFTMTASSAPTWMNGYYIASGITGINVAAAVTTGWAGSAAAATAAWAATGSLTTAVNHGFRFKIRILTNLATNWRMRYTSNTGTTQSLIGSYYIVRELPTASTGTFVA